MKIADRNDNCMALFFIELDRFKQINDSLGHESGDPLLKTVARRLVKVVRKQDTLARLGGNEFVMLLESFENLTQLGEIAREITRSISQLITLEQRDVSVTPSIGVALYPNDADITQELLRWCKSTGMVSPG